MGEPAGADMLSGWMGAQDGQTHKMAMQATRPCVLNIRALDGATE